ncbi:MAG TPA: protein kinase [Polyangiaceae bacterium]
MLEGLPRVIDRYELLSELGSGGFATVYRARHVLTQQDVAVKVLRPRGESSERWIVEARAAAAVQHKNVVRVLDCGRAGDEVFIVMDLVAGPTLADVIASHGPLPPWRAATIAIQLLDGLGAAHARGIVHRDIKPPNVILTRDENGGDLPMILDFGVSKQTTEMSITLDGTAIGTPGYMAPELFGGAKHADARADIYAIAATLYEMLSGKLPFAARTYEELVVQVATSRPAPISSVAPHVPAEIAAAVDRGLARDREARWGTAEQFASALRGALVGVAPPSSDAFQATMEARMITEPNASPRVPTLAVPDPSTLRTAPPPVVSTANRNESRSRGALSLAVGLVGIVLAVGGVTALVVGFRMRPHATVGSVATSATIAPTPSLVAASSPPREGDTSLDPAAGGTSPSPATVDPHPATSATSPARTSLVGGPGVSFLAIQTVGAIKSTELDAFTARVVPTAQRCRPPHGSAPVVARVQLVGIHENGEIAIAQPASPDPGDLPTARCIANVLKAKASSATLHPSGGGGIATIEARLDPL